MSKKAHSKADLGTIQWTDTGGPAHTTTGSWWHSENLWHVRSPYPTKAVPGEFIFDIPAPYGDFSGTAQIPEDTIVYSWFDNGGVRWSFVANGEIRYVIEADQASTAEFNFTLKNRKVITGSFNLMQTPLERREPTEAARKRLLEKSAQSKP